VQRGQAEDYGEAHDPQGHAEVEAHVALGDHDVEQAVECVPEAHDHLLEHVRGVVAVRDVGHALGVAHVRAQERARGGLLAFG